MASKQAEAQRVLGEINGIDHNLERAVEAYDLANVRLAHIQHELRVNGHDLAVARSNLGVSQRRLSQRLVAIYTGGQQPTTLEIPTSTRPTIHRSSPTVGS